MDPTSPRRLPLLASLASLDSSSPPRANLTALSVNLAPSKFITGPPLVPCVILAPTSANQDRPDAPPASPAPTRTASLPPPVLFVRKAHMPTVQGRPSAPYAQQELTNQDLDNFWAARAAARASIPPPSGPTLRPIVLPARLGPTPTTPEPQLAGPADAGTTPPPLDLRAPPTAPCSPLPSPSAAMLL